MHTQEILFAVLVIILMPLFDYLLSARFQNRINDGTMSKESFYFISIMELWIPAGILFSIFAMNKTDFTLIFLKSPTLFAFSQLTFFHWIAVIVTLVLILFVCLLAYNYIRVLSSESYAKAYAQVIQRPVKSNKSKSIDSLLLMPRTKQQRAYWVVVSATAGFVEECIYRGFVVYFLNQYIPGITLEMAYVLQAIPFAILHSYQGLAGIIQSLILGIALGFLTYLTDSLLIAILLHFLIDLFTGLTSRIALNSESAEIIEGNLEYSTK